MASIDSDATAPRTMPLILFYIAATLLITILITILLWALAHFIAQGRALKAAGYKPFRWPGDKESESNLTRALANRFTRNVLDRFGRISVAGLVLSMISLTFIFKDYEAATTPESEHVMLWAGLLVVWIVIACAYLGYVVHLARRIDWREMSSGNAMKGIRLDEIDEESGRDAEGTGLL